MNEQEEQRRAVMGLVYTTLHEIHKGIQKRGDSLEADAWLMSTAKGLGVSYAFLRGKMDEVRKALESGWRPSLGND